MLMVDLIIIIIIFAGSINCHAHLSGERRCFIVIVAVKRQSLITILQQYKVKWEEKRSIEHTIHDTQHIYLFVSSLIHFFLIR